MDDGGDDSPLAFGLVVGSDDGCRCGGGTGIESMGGGDDDDDDDDDTDDGVPSNAGVG
jgi:hypothetical protein